MLYLICWPFYLHCIFYFLRQWKEKIFLFSTKKEEKWYDVRFLKKFRIFSFRTPFKSLSTDRMSRWCLDKIILPLCITIIFSSLCLRTGSMESFPCAIKIEGTPRRVQYNLYYNIYDRPSKNLPTDPTSEVKIITSNR